VPTGVRQRGEGLDVSQGSYPSSKRPDLLKNIMTFCARRKLASGLQQLASPSNLRIFSTKVGIFSSRIFFVRDRRVRTAFQPLAIIRVRIGLRMNRAIATTAMFMMAVSKNTRCQLPVDDLIRLANGTRKAEVPFAV
jgi:hypothetical protein